MDITWRLGEILEWLKKKNDELEAVVTSCFRRWLALNSWNTKSKKTTRTANASFGVSWTGAKRHVSPVGARPKRFGAASSSAPLARRFAFVFPPSLLPRDEDGTSWLDSFPAEMHKEKDGARSWAKYWNVLNSLSFIPWFLFVYSVVVN